MPSRKTILILDAHALIHRAFHALPSLTTPGGEVVGAVYGFTSVLIKVLRELNPDYAVAAFDLPGPTFRHKEYQEYKATRPATPDDLKEQFGKIREVVSAFGIPILEKEGYEADDIIGTLTKRSLAKEKEKGTIDIVILSGDLDTLQLVDDHTRVYTFKKGFSDTAFYDIPAVRDRFGIEPEHVGDYKGLTGDPSDNIPGVPGVGGKTASHLLKHFISLEELYAHLEEAEVSPRVKTLLQEYRDQAFFSKELATIRTNTPLTFNLRTADWRGHHKRDALHGLLKHFGFFSLESRINDLFSADREKGEGRSDRKALRRPVAIPRLTDNKKAQFLNDHRRVALNLQADEQGKTQLVLSRGGSTVILDMSASEARAFLLEERIPKIVYDLKSILKKLWENSLDIRGVTMDVMIAAYLLRPGARDYSLDYVCFSYLDVSSRSESIGQRVLSLGEALSNDLTGANLEKVFYGIEMPLVRILARMEEAGVIVDRAALDRLKKNISQELSSFTQQIYREAGETFNINSPREVRTILFEKLKIPSRAIKKTSTGLISTSQEYLKTIISYHPIVGLLLSYRELAKLKSTYIDVFLRLIDRESGRIHTTFHQTGTATGRLSSSNPNLQNIPLRGSWAERLRGAFHASPKNTFVSFDYSQIELRIIAHLARDEKMIEAFSRGEDIHAFTASLVWGVDIAHVDTIMRELAKTINFGILYGISASRLARSSGMGASEARSFLKKYFTHFEGVARYIEETKERARRDGYVETLLGRRRYLPDIHSSSHELRSQAERMAVNMTAQGTNADLIKLAMIRIDEYVSRARIDAQLILQIHDDLLFEVRRGIVGEVVPRMKDIMEHVISLIIPLRVDVKIGETWGNMVEYK